MNRHRHGMQVHPYQYAAYIHTGARHALYILDHDGLVEHLGRSHAPCAARMQSGLHADLLKAVLFHALTLNYHRAVQMLAALTGKIEPALAHCGKHRFHYRLCDILGGMSAHVEAHDTARRAADHDYIALFEGRDIVRGGPRVGEPDLAVIQKLGNCRFGLRFYSIQ